ncbi:unnamed protein product [Urochloa humidicola]
MARNGKREESPFERIDACIEDLKHRHDDDYYYYYYPKTKPSPATLEAAMAGIVGELEGHNLPLEALDMRCLTIFDLEALGITIGAVGLLLLTLRDGSLLDEAFPALCKAIHDEAAAPPPALVAAAVDCLAAASFAGARHADAAQRSMDAIWRVIVPPARSRSAKLKTAETTSPVVLAAAVSAWTFLLTTVMQRKAGRTGWSAAIASLMEMLDANDRTVRMAAGEALAVCVELNLTKDNDMGALAAKVSDLAAEPAGKRADNSLLREQKELFGQIAGFLDRNEPPVASWEWQDMMKVSTWVRLAQLKFLRKFLGDGFFNHVQRNPLLSEAFSFGRVEGKPLTIRNKERSMPIDDFLWDTKRDWSGVSDSIYVVHMAKCRTQKLLQLGWH